MTEQELQALALLLGGRYYDGKVLIGVDAEGLMCTKCYLFPDTHADSDCRCPGTNKVWQPLVLSPNPNPNSKE
jgi:hypothetical protein